jgi:alpha-tubulin suppressor-like RCC1 family protein
LQLKSYTNVSMIAASVSHTTVLMGGGKLMSTVGEVYGAQLNVPKGVWNIHALTTGYSHIVVINGDGSLVAWGNNSNGICNIPLGLKGAKAIAAGWYHTLAIKSDSTVVSWGQNDRGQCTLPIDVNP